MQSGCEEQKSQHGSHDCRLETCISVARLAFDHHLNLILGVRATGGSTWRLVSYPADTAMLLYLHLPAPMPMVASAQPTSSSERRVLPYLPAYSYANFSIITSARCNPQEQKGCVQAAITRTRSSSVYNRRYVDLGYLLIRSRTTRTTGPTERLGFHTYLQTISEPLKEFPAAHLPLIAKLVHEW